MILVILGSQFLSGSSTISLIGQDQMRVESLHERYSLISALTVSICICVQCLSFSDFANWLG